MYTQFVTIFIFLLIGAAIVPAILLVGKILRPDHPDEKKLTTYECGEEPIGSSWVQFNLRFYVIAIIFLIFDVEAVALFPVATVFRQWISSSPANAWLVFIEVSIFLLILIVGFAYAWHKGDFAWIRGTKGND